MTINVGKNVFDEDFAAELLAEETHISADNGTKVEQDRRLAGRQPRQEFSKSFRGEYRLADGRWHITRHVVVASTGGQTIKETQRSISMKSKQVQGFKPFEPLNLYA